MKVNDNYQMQTDEAFLTAMKLCTYTRALKLQVIWDSQDMTKFSS